jgi:hypothetical protein
MDTVPQNVDELMAEIAQQVGDNSITYDDVFYGQAALMQFRPAPRVIEAAKQYAFKLCAYLSLDLLDVLDHTLNKTNSHGMKQDWFDQAYAIYSFNWERAPLYHDVTNRIRAAVLVLIAQQVLREQRWIGTPS